MLNFRSINVFFRSILLVILFGIALNYLPFLTVLPLLLIWLIITALGSAIIGWNYHFKSLNKHSDETQNRVAITFDDGPNPKFTPQVLALLHTFNAKATFFCIGKHMQAYPEIVKQILEQGHSIGNHTFSHSNSFGFFNSKRVQLELEQTNQIFKAITGLQLQLYRPAFGVTNPNIKKAIEHLGLQSVGWNKRSFDTTNLSRKRILNRVTKDLRPGDVILLHDTSQKTIDILEQLLLFLQQQNITSVSIDALFDIEAYA